MAEPYVIFNGVSSADLGVIVTRLPDFHRPARNVTRVQVPGRDGRLTVEDGAYDIYQTTLAVNCNGVSLATALAWLNGGGWLISSDEPARKVLCDVHAQVKDERFRAGGCYDTLTATVWCQPYRYYVEDPAVTLSAAGRVDNPGTAACRPVITIQGSGNVTLTVGAEPIACADLTDGIVIDCAAQDCLNPAGTQLMNSSVTLEEFPIIPPGGCAVSWTGNVSSVAFLRGLRDL